jgi:hypothetical protein
MNIRDMFHFHYRQEKTEIHGFEIYYGSGTRLRMRESRLSNVGVELRSPKIE